MKKSRILKLALAFVALSICIMQISETYAKYTEAIEGDTNFTIAKWKILVNSKDITGGTTMSSLINPTYIPDDNIKAGVIAPGSRGYFTLDVDASNTDVSFKYNIFFGNSAENTVSDLKITGYKIDSGEIISTTDNENTVTNTIRQNDPNKTFKITIYFEWLEGEGETMNNKKDTDASISQIGAKIKTNISFTQVNN